MNVATRHVHTGLEVTAMTRENKCVECRHCEMRIGAKRGTRYYCVRKKHGLTAEVDTRPACEKFALPSLSMHWGP